MAIKFEEMTPSPIENATVKKAILNGVFSSYRISANEGYKLHDKILDDVKFDENGNETDKIILGYSEGTKSCGANYNWNENPREFYAVQKKSDNGGE